MDAFVVQEQMVSTSTPTGQGQERWWHSTPLREPCGRTIPLPCWRRGADALQRQAFAGSATTCSRPKRSSSSCSMAIGPLTSIPLGRPGSPLTAANGVTRRTQDNPPGAQCQRDRGGTRRMVVHQAPHQRLSRGGHFGKHEGEKLAQAQVALESFSTRSKVTWSGWG